MLTFAAALGRRSRQHTQERLLPRRTTTQQQQQVRGLRTKRSKLYPNKSSSSESEKAKLTEPRAGNISLGLSQRESNHGSLGALQDTSMPPGGLDEMFGLGRFAPGAQQPPANPSTMRRINRPEVPTKGEGGAVSGAPGNQSRSKSKELVALRAAMNRKKGPRGSKVEEKPKYMMSGRTAASGTMGGRFPGGNINQPHLGKFPQGPPPPPVGMPRGLSKKAAKRYRRKEARAHKRDPQWKLKTKLLERSMSPLGGIEDEGEVMKLEDGRKIAKLILADLMPSTWKSRSDTEVVTFDEAMALVPKPHKNRPYMPMRHLSQPTYDPDAAVEIPVGPDVLAIQEAAVSRDPEHALVLFDKHEALALADDRPVESGGLGIHPAAVLASAQALCSLNRSKEARDLVEFNIRSGKVKGTSAMLETVVNGLLKERHRHQALVFARTMLATHKADWCIDATKLEITAYASLIAVYKANHVVEKALQVLDFATEGVGVIICPEQDAQTLFHESIDACASKYQFAHIAYDLLIEMNMACFPSNETYNKVLNACRMIGDIQKAEQLWLEIEANPALTHTRQHYNQMLHVLARTNWQTNRKKKPAPMWLKYTPITEQRVKFVQGDEVGALALSFEGKPLDAMPTQAGNIVWDRSTNREVRRGTAKLHATAPAELALLQDEVAAVTEEDAGQFTGSLASRMLNELPAEISNELRQLGGELNDDYIDDEEEEERIRMIEQDDMVGEDPNKEAWESVENQDLFAVKLRESAQVSAELQRNNPEGERHTLEKVGGLFIPKREEVPKKKPQHNVPGMDGWLDELDGGAEGAAVEVGQLSAVPFSKNAYVEPRPLPVEDQVFGGRSGKFQYNTMPTGAADFPDDEYDASGQPTERAAEFELEMIWSPAGVHEFPTFDLSYYREKRPGQIQKYVIDRAEALMNEMIAKGMPPTTDTINARVDVFAQAYRLNMAEQAWSMYEEYGLQPNEASYFTMIRMFKRCTRLERAEEYFEKMKADPNIKHISGRVLCEMGDGMARRGRTQKAQEFLEEAVRGGYHPKETHLRVLRFRLKKLAEQEERNKMRLGGRQREAPRQMVEGETLTEMSDRMRAAMLGSTVQMQDPDAEEEEREEDLEVEGEEEEEEDRMEMKNQSESDDDDDDDDYAKYELNADDEQAYADDDDILVMMNSESEADAQYLRENADFEGAVEGSENNIQQKDDDDEGDQPTHVTSSMEFAMDAQAIIQQRLKDDPNPVLTAKERRHKALVENREKERLRRTPRANLMVNRKRIEDPATGKIYIYPKGRGPKQHKNHLASFLWYDFTPPVKRPYKPNREYQPLKPQNNQFFER